MVMSIAEQLRSHFEQRLRAADLVRWPFPHLVLTGVFPDEWYERLLDASPFEVDGGVRYGDPSWTERLSFRHYYDHRFHHDLHPARRSLTDPLWETVGDVFSDPLWLGRLLFERFPEFFEFRFGDIDAIEAHEPGGFWGRLQTQTFLQRHEPGFQLDAHTDIPSRVATCVFNLPREAGDEDAGTQLLVPNDPRWRCSGNSHYPLDGFRVVGTVPYAPNTGVVFFKTRHSWHGVGPHASSARGGRVGMQVQLYEPERGAVTDLSAPDLVVNRQLRPVSGRARFGRRVRRVARRVVRRGR
ncbi:MAG: hypothetical protein RI958_112 [Actinomycetota bacterium]